jgi:hypothetical protein
MAAAESGAVVTIRLGGRPSAVGVGGGSVWVLHTFEAKVSRIAPHR